MDDANGKPLDLGSVVEALETVVTVLKSGDPAIVDTIWVPGCDVIQETLLDRCENALTTLRSTVTPAPVAKVVVDLSGLDAYDAYVWETEGGDDEVRFEVDKKGDWYKKYDLLALMAQLPGVEVINAD